MFSTGKQLWLKLSRTLATVRREPQEIVTVLRIVEREEQADAELRDALATDYVPPGRPKRWRQRALQVRRGDRGPTCRPDGPNAGDSARYR